MRELYAKMNYFRELVQLPEFLQRKGLGNEIPYFIFDYQPEHELDVRDYVQTLRERVTINIVEVNLYKLMLELFEKEVGSIDALFDLEAAEGTDELFTAMQPVLEDETLVAMIAEQAQKADVLFLTGVGTVFPLVRSHTILNRMQRYPLDAPLVMFYPGVYDGSEVKLFGLTKDENYYRAFRIVPQ